MHPLIKQCIQQRLAGKTELQAAVHVLVGVDKAWVEDQCEQWDGHRNFNVLRVNCRAKLFELTGVRLEDLEKDSD